ncbi:hypothetical protein SAMN02910384_00871 [Pseudobutyrivibrio sp. ACV-2]|uniref:hypothetical protein n=1 Tax=Pseudobutyrivibrio sp. ACV-2 TaxID=1520801 RepID=UPI0008996CF6|nr:hypothetical protein [Pseudobutyrivibrio sp. ACV-2]SEA10402.1 hypothetical protein SAMN02910384_00871 [Pseudobutyrivibrio sp. ACV-2]
MLEKEEQRLGRNKETQINKSYIDSSDYRRKFDTISDNPALNRLIYDLAKRMLIHRTGTHREDMFWLDVGKCQIVAEETDAAIDGRIEYSRKTISTIRKYKKDQYSFLLTVHTHPSSFPPSIDDFNTNYTNEYFAGLVICHNGAVYFYSAGEYINPQYYEIKVADYFSRGYNECEAQILALENMKSYFDIDFEEVCVDDNGKRYI